MKISEKEKSRRARERALEAKALRDRGLTFAQIGIMLGKLLDHDEEFPDAVLLVTETGSIVVPLSRQRAEQLASVGARIKARRAAAGII